MIPVSLRTLVRRVNSSQGHWGHGRRMRSSPCPDLPEPPALVLPSNGDTVGLRVQGSWEPAGHGIGVAAPLSVWASDCGQESFGPSYSHSDRSSYTHCDLGLFGIRRGALSSGASWVGPGLLGGVSCGGSGGCGSF